MIQGSAGLWRFSDVPAEYSSPLSHAATEHLKCATEEVNFKSYLILIS